MRKAAQMPCRRFSPRGPETAAIQWHCQAIDANVHLPICLTPALSGLLLHRSFFQQLQQVRLNVAVICAQLPGERQRPAGHRAAIVEYPQQSTTEIVSTLISTHWTVGSAKGARIRR